MRKARGLLSKAFWLFLCNTISQLLSWIITILIARILNPIDYGLFELGTIIIGYAGIFGELGLGAAIIQKLDSTEDELSSVFWFITAISIIICFSCIPISYVTGYIFAEKRIIPIGQVMGITFLLSGLQVVPQNILNKKMEFKQIGIIELISTIVTANLMLLIAYMGGGAWTLVGGLIIRSLTKLILLYWVLKWFPRWHFNAGEAKEYIKFGSLVALGRSMSYFYEISDRFFGGRTWPPQILGGYSLALNLSKMPTEKITVFINQISFPMLAKLQYKQEEFNVFYLKIIRITVSLVLPLFVGGFLISEELILVVLGEKWAMIVYTFKYLCLSQIWTSLNAINGFVHYAQGRPNWSLGFHGACAMIMPVSFWLAAKHGMDAMVIPWVGIYTVICTLWIYVTTKKIKIDAVKYLGIIKGPTISVLGMSSVIILFRIAAKTFELNLNMRELLIIEIILGGVIYSYLIYCFDRNMLYELRQFFTFR